MIFNKSRKQMYFLLNNFDKTNNFKKSMQNTKNKFKLDDVTLGFRIHECVVNNYVNGISSKSSIANTYHNDLRTHIFITYTGYDFLKNYHSFIKHLILEITLIILTAILTAFFTNYFELIRDDTIASNAKIINTEVCNILTDK